MLIVDLVEVEGGENIAGVGNIKERVTLLRVDRKINNTGSI